MNFLIMCSKARHEIISDEKIVKGDKFQCFSTCPKRSTCPNASKNEFSVISAMSLSALKNPIEVKKHGDKFVKIGDEISTTSVDTKKDENSTIQPITNFSNPVNNTNSAQNNASQTGFVAFNNPNNNANNQTGFVGFGFNTNNQSNSAPQAQQAANTSASYRDRFSFNRPQNVEVKKKISDTVKLSDFNSVMLGGRIYSNDFTLQRTKGAFPLGRLLGEIRSHWHVKFVFKDQNNLSREFIWVLLKLGIIPNAKKE